MGLVTGPVLGLRGIRSGRYEVGALVVADGTDGEAPPELIWGAPATPAESAPPVLLARRGRLAVWRFDAAVVQDSADRTVPYAVAGEEHRFTVPAAGRAPRIAYTSCNGFSSLKAMKNVRDSHALWRVMAARHAERPYHLLLMGGDQVYADSLWESLPALRRWSALPYEVGNRAPFRPRLAAQVGAFFLDLYARRWIHPEMRPLLAAIPTVMMWDDHDIVDGWGSYPPERQSCPVFQGIFAVADQHFGLFQRQESGRTAPACSLAPEHGWSAGYHFGDLALLVLDLRSERTHEQVLSPAHWDRVYAWLDGLAGERRPRHLLVMASIPLIHPGFAAIERALGVLPGNQELEDDLRDHWTTRPHRAERLRLIHRLLAFAAREKARVTIVSGDVHVAALGYLESQREELCSNAAVINQLTSSGIVHPGPSGSLLFALEHLFPVGEEIDRGITAEMTPFPGTERRYIGTRNWLSLEPDEPGASDAGRYWANFIVEGEPIPFTKVIHPVE